MPIYAYECPKGHGSEQFFSVAEMQRNVKCRCGLWASQIITPVAIHTIGTFSKGILDPEVQKSMACDGSYLDPTLSYDPKTGKVVAPITSEKQRQKLMAERGLYEKVPEGRVREADNYKRRKPKSFSATGTRA